MILYRKTGGAPRPLPDVDYDVSGMSWTDLANNPEGLAACGWTLAPAVPPHDPATTAVTWSADDEAWILTPIPEPEPPAPTPPQPIRIGKYWLMERFSSDQEKRFTVLEARARALTPEQIEDPAFDGLYQLTRFLKRLDALTVVELDAPATIGAFELLRLLGVFGDPEDSVSVEERTAMLVAPTGRELT